MDFFDRQRYYKQQSLLLYVAFFAVIGLHLMAGLWILQQMQMSMLHIVFFMVVIVAVFAIGYGIQAHRLKDGGMAIARLLSAKKLVLDPDGRVWQSYDAGEVFENEQMGVRFKYTHDCIIAKDKKAMPSICHRFFEISEQMSISSGMPMPVLYVMTHIQTINAFVVGNDDNLALGVTQGALEKLDDEAFYGLIAHAFGRILHGDTRFNLQLMKVLAGLNFLQTMGVNAATTNTYRYSNKKDHRLQLMVVLCYLLSSSAIFCGWLIKLGFSQQRAMLADATCVQLTRSFAIKHTLQAVFDDGGGKIEEVARWAFLFFVDTDNNDWRTTHPSIEKRLQAIDKKTYANFARHVMDSLQN